MPRSLKVTAALDATRRRPLYADEHQAIAEALATIVELAERCKRLEAQVARHERDIAPKRKVGGLG
jgi:hypothetical protein